MTDTPALSTSGLDVDAPIAAFYRRVLERLTAGDVPFLVGGAFACTAHTGIERPTKDLDLFLRRADLARACAVMHAAGYRTELPFSHWLAKVHEDGASLDLIFSSGNGISAVDDEWFAHAGRDVLLGVPVSTAPAEETIWSKAFVMERERYDGADVAHLLRARAATLDWPRLLRRFDPHWRVLLSHLLLFGFVYPADRGRVPAWVMEHLLDRLRLERHLPPTARPACQGTLLSREQYLFDIEHLGLQDARLAPLGAMTAQEVRAWTQAIPGRARGGN